MHIQTQSSKRSTPENFDENILETVSSISLCSEERFLFWHSVSFTLPWSVALAAKSEIAGSTRQLKQGDTMTLLKHKLRKKMSFDGY